MLNNPFTRQKTPAYSANQIDILRLIRSENIGPKTFARLIRLFGSAGKALDRAGEFSLRGGRSKPIKICSKESAEKEIELLNKNKSYLLTFEDPGYSKLLSQIPDFPPVITYKGNIELFNHDKIIAMVGARNSSVNGRLFAGKIAKELVGNGFVTISGLARGIDTAVHNASLEKTIAVIAGGIDHIYPPENTKLFELLADKSLIIAELPIGAKPLAQHFPQRNRIISGSSQATIVVEAGINSGSLITANFALEQNREVFAVPGFPLDPRCMGSNKLIKDGAYLLESSGDVISVLSSDLKMQKLLEDSASYSNNFNIPAIDSYNDPTSADRKAVIELLSASAVTYETLAEESGLSMPLIYVICLELELAGKITILPGNRISLKII